MKGCQDGQLELAKKNHDEARQAVEQVNQGGFAITVLGVKTSQLDRALSNWD